MGISKKVNVNSYDVYINGDYYGSNITSIQVNTNDEISIDIMKNDNSLDSTLFVTNELI
jgi:hypothetical protein